MKTKILFLFIICCLLLGVASCTNSDNTNIETTNSPDIDNPPDTTLMESTDNPNINNPSDTTLSEEQAKAYFVVFEELYDDDPGLNSEIKYLAVDLSNVKLTDITSLIEKIQNFCDDHEYILLQDTFEGLGKKGYIKDLYFDEGILISFKDKKLDSDILVTTAQKWRGGDGVWSRLYSDEKQ